MTGPSLVDKAGTLEACGGGFCLAGASLDLGGAGALSGAAGADYDGDGTTEDNAGELAGLVGSGVTLTVDEQSTAWVVYSINGVTYRDGNGAS